MLEFLLEKKVPRYTSYPPASSWGGMDALAYKIALAKLQEQALSFYVHIPFCSSICHYCGCTTYLNQNPQIEKEYINTLLKEIRLLKESLPEKRTQNLHFGGGSPSKLSVLQLKSIVDMFKAVFPFCETAEISIEIDPRTICQDPFSFLQELQKIGFTRLSFGVQDLDENVQRAIGRNQKRKQTFDAIEAAKILNFKSTAVDLVYGLPCQTEETFLTTVDGIIQLRVPRICLFSFAYLPELKPNQKAISPSLLPSTLDKFILFSQAKNQFLKAGYISIGLDHFVLPEDELAVAFAKKGISRGFQGYFPYHSSTTIGVGASSISTLPCGYYQNTKNLALYASRILEDCFATERGTLLSQDDIVRAHVIESIMCYGSIDKKIFKQNTGHAFDEYFLEELHRLSKELPKELLENTSTYLQATPTGQFFLRNLAACFDKRYDPSSPASQG